MRIDIQTRGFHAAVLARNNSLHGCSYVTCNIAQGGRVEKLNTAMRCSQVLYWQLRDPDSCITSCVAQLVLSVEKSTLFRLSMYTRACSGSDDTRASRGGRFWSRIHALRGGVVHELVASNVSRPLVTLRTWKRFWRPVPCGQSSLCD